LPKVNYRPFAAIFIAKHAFFASEGFSPKKKFWGLFSLDCVYFNIGLINDSCWSIDKKISMIKK
jgi:hypothetical protein